jgi:uncharacterized protein YqhQ
MKMNPRGFFTAVKSACFGKKNLNKVSNDGKNSFGEKSVWVNQKGGFIQLIILIVIGLLVLSYFGISLQGVVESPVGQSNLHYVTNGASYVWNNYLSAPFDYLWNTVFIGMLWSAFTENLNRVKNNQPTQIQELSPNVNLR